MFIAVFVIPVPLHFPEFLTTERCCNRYQRTDIALVARFCTNLECCCAVYGHSDIRAELKQRERRKTHVDVELYSDIIDFQIIDFFDVTDKVIDVIRVSPCSFFITEYDFRKVFYESISSQILIKIEKLSLIERLYVIFCLKNVPETSCEVYSDLIFETR